MKDYFTAHFPLHSETFAPYADLFAMVLCLVITGKCKYEKKHDNTKKINENWKIFFIFILVLLIVGIKESAVLNNVFTFVNLTVIILVVVVGLTKIHGHNWSITPDEVCQILFTFNYKYCIFSDTQFNECDI